MTLTLTIPAPAPWINTNTRMHRMAKANLTKQWREICPKIPGNTRNFGRIETAPKSACNTHRGLTRSSGTSREGLPQWYPK